MPLEVESTCGVIPFKRKWCIVNQNISSWKPRRVSKDFEMATLYQSYISTSQSDLPHFLSFSLSIKHFLCTFRNRYIAFPTDFAVCVKCQFSRMVLAPPYTHVRQPMPPNGHRQRWKINWKLLPRIFFFSLKIYLFS